MENSIRVPKSKKKKKNQIEFLEMKHNNWNQRFLRWIPAEDRIIESETKLGETSKLKHTD